MLILAALVGGLFALVVLVVAIDTWSQASRERNGAPTEELETAKPLEPATAEGPPWNWEKVEDLESGHPWGSR